MNHPTDSPGRAEGDPAEETTVVGGSAGTDPLPDPGTDPGTDPGLGSAPAASPAGDAAQDPGDPSGAGPDDDHAAAAGAERFARRWLHALSRCDCLLIPAAEAADLVRPLATRLASAVQGPQLDLASASAVGRALTDVRFNQAEVLEHTVATVVENLADDLGATTAASLRSAVPALAGALAQGFAQALGERVTAEQQERLDTRHRLEAIFAEAAVGIGIVDPRGRVLDVNPTMAAMIGLPADQLRGQTLRQVVGTSTAEVTQHYRDLISGRIEHVRLELGRESPPQPLPEGALTHLDLSMSMVRDAQGRPDFMIAIALDVSERRRLADRLWQESRHDPLTGLANRVLFFERLADLLADPRTAPRVGLCILDLDGFKNVNDGFGHDIGDRLLSAVADRLRDAAAGEGRLLARLGGDEFAMLTDGTPGLPDLAQDAQALLDALVQPIAIAGHQLTVSTSIGIVEASSAGSDPDLLLRAADITLYQAKAHRKGGWLRYDPERSAGEVNRHALATAIPAALAGGQFHLEFQPQVMLGSGRVRSVEALVRWRHPDLGLLGPQLFVPLAEETGNAAALGRWVLVEACRAARRWHRDHPEARIGMSVNVTGRQLREPHFVDDVLAVLAATGLPVDLLRLELTESVLLDDPPDAMEALDALAARGVALVIDEFGTGHSSLSRLNRLPVSELKMAGTFLRSRQVPGGTADTIVSSIITLAHSLDLMVTAERVETRAQVERLTELGCDAGQGWYFGRPTDAAVIEAMLSASRGGGGATPPG